jgi:hypothetical protein
MKDKSAEAVDAACRAYLMEQTQGLCDEWPNNCDMCDCFRMPATAAYERKHMTAALKAAIEVLST